MQYGALIVAAGMSSRMGDFKPMMSIGSISVAQRIVATLRQAGVQKIVMVTGYNATALERHLSGNGVIFVRNEDYATTQMFDSVKIGLAYLEGKCDKILFTPVDVPLFTYDTVRKIMDASAPLVTPVCAGKLGHPVAIDNAMVGSILADCGEQGLKGALERCPAKMQYLEVDDQGTIQDADTPEDFSALLNYHNSQLIRPVVSLGLAREKVFLDEKRVMLLELVEETASVRSACQRMQISYSTGWNLIKVLESQLGTTLILRSQGGANGGQSQLTAYGKDLSIRYRRCMEELQVQAEDLYKKYFTEVFHG